jgi:hypothetical protein
MNCSRRRRALTVRLLSRESWREDTAHSNACTCRERTRCGYVSGDESESATGELFGWCAQMAGVNVTFTDLE